MKTTEAKDRLDIFKTRFNQLRGSRSQDAFAKFLGISRPTVGFYENGQRLPDAFTLRQIAERCQVSADWLIGLTDNMTSENEAIGKELGLTDRAIERLRLLNDRNQVVITHNPTMPDSIATGTAAKKYIESGLKGGDRIIHNYELNVINTLLETDGGLLRELEKFLYYRYQRPDGQNACINVKIQDDIESFISPIELNNMHMVTIQSKLFELRKEIVEGGLENGNNTQTR